MLEWTFDLFIFAMFFFQVMHELWLWKIYVIVLIFSNISSVIQTFLCIDVIYTFCIHMTTLHYKLFRIASFFRLKSISFNQLTTIRNRVMKKAKRSQLIAATCMSIGRHVYDRKHSWSVRMYLFTYLFIFHCPDYIDAGEQWLGARYTFDNGQIIIIIIIIILHYNKNRLLYQIKNL